MTTAPTDPARHSRRPRGPRTGVRIAVATLLAVPVFGLTAAWATYAHLQGNLETADDVDEYLGASRPTVATSADPLTDGFAGAPLNILVMGVDARDGDNAKFAGYVDGQRSDSTFLVHLPADRSRIDVVSIPRDSLVDIPSCLLADGTETGDRTMTMFNAAFEIGSGPDDDLTTAAACTRRTFEQNSGVRTDEHVVVKMDGVRDVIDVLGGVPFCFPEAMDSDDAKLHVDAGPRVLDGKTSIAFLRARTGTGWGLWIGSDLGRLDRQHVFLEALTDKVHDDDLLGDPAKLLKVLDRATKSLAVSPGLGDLRTLAGLANGLRGIDGTEIEAITVPNEPYGKKGRVVWTAAAEDVWQRIREDRPLTDPKPKPHQTRGTGTVSTPDPQESTGPCG
ncbi:LCP family protein [Cellulomonas sp.]|uniref:LCP family protein n=1 Tax=Cellulomonas sp. TaxID=40001 RepID=UPI00258EBD5F|nr:LCP family protein [Cellulomonas sp.]MCR6689564.1 LCP family protein [Cellulomonas sp.]